MPNNSKIKKEALREYIVEAPNYLTYFMFSFFLMSPSAILIEISQSLGIRPADFSLVFTFFTAGLVLGQFTCIFYSKCISRINLISFNYVLLVAISIIMFFIKNLYMFYLLYGIAGYFLGTAYIQANQYILQSRVKNKAKMLTITTTFFPIGAVTAPVVSIFVVNSGWGWRSLYLISGFMFMLIFLLYQAITRRRKYNIRINTEEALSLKQILSNKNKNLVFAITCLAIFFYAVAETVIFTWSPTFLREVRGVDVFAAGYILTIFWVVIIIGRIINSKFTDRLPPLKLIFYLTIIGIIALFFMLYLETTLPIFISAVFTGLGFSAIFPLLVYYGSTLYEQRTSLFLPVLLVTGTLANALTPYIVSIVSRKSMTLSISIALLSMAVVLALIVSQLILTKAKSK